MAIENISLFSEGSHAVLTLRTAQQADMDSLREWKNSKRQFFFHTDLISPKQQNEWYERYMARPHDYMFVVVVGGQEIGCLGIRLQEGEWDVYNVILGNPSYENKGFMSRALNLMLRFAYGKQSFPIRLKVLKKNPAVAWYQKNAFSIISEGDHYFVMQYENRLLGG